MRPSRPYGYPVADDDVAARLSPLGDKHVLHGAYSFVLPDLAPGTIRGLRDPGADDEDE
jgi:hypothetical protein